MTVMSVGFNVGGLIEHYVEEIFVGYYTGWGDFGGRHGCGREEQCCSQCFGCHCLDLIIYNI